MLEIGRTKLVCEVYVLDPVVAKVAHEDHGPETVDRRLISESSRRSLLKAMLNNSITHGMLRSCIPKEMSEHSPVIKMNKIRQRQTYIIVRRPSGQMRAKHEVISSLLQDSRCLDTIAPQIRCAGDIQIVRCEGVNTEAIGTLFPVSMVSK